MTNKRQWFLLVYLLQLVAQLRSENTRLRDEIARSVIAGGADADR